MHDAVWLALALAFSTLGMAWLALSMDTHWEQVCGAGHALPRRTAVGLRWLGACALAGSLALCLAVDHASMASLVWAMTLAGAALAVAFVLAWRPRWLAPLVACSPRPPQGAGVRRDR